MKQLISFLLSVAALTAFIAAIVFVGFDWGKALVDAQRVAGKEVQLLDDLCMPVRR